MLAGGFQGATNFTGSTISTRGIQSGKKAYFLAARWTPDSLAGGAYSLLWGRFAWVAVDILGRQPKACGRSNVGTKLPMSSIAGNINRVSSRDHYGGSEDSIRDGRNSCP